MYQSVELPRVSSLVLHESIMSAYTLSPFAHLDTVVDQKRMKTLEKPFNDLYEAQLALFASFTEFRYCYKYGSGCTTNHYLAGLYGTWAKRAKEFGILLKKHANQKEIADYYVHMMAFVKVDVYEAMKHDFVSTIVAFAARRAVDMAKYPEWDQWEPLALDWEVVNKRYKEAK